MSKLVIYTTGFCGYCHSAKSFLQSQEIEFEEIPIDKERGMREQMVERAGRTSVPQIFVGDTHIGGYDDMMALHGKGEFLPMLES